MKIFWGPDTFLAEEHILIIGNFDGVHSGHLKLIEKARSLKKDNEKIGIITFYPHPEIVLHSRTDNFLLTTYDEKIKIFEEQGIDTVFFVEFTANFSKMTPPDFVDYIMRLTDVRQIVVGRNFKFGNQARGHPQFIRNHLKKKNIDVNIAPIFRMGRTPVSASLIRSLITECRFDEAERFLGRKYMISGTVMHGKKEGRIIGFPTANLNVQNKILPKPGVYSGYSYYGGEKFFSLACIGAASMLPEEDTHLEIWMDGFTKEIYGETLSIHLEKFVRNLKKVGSKDDLKAIIEKDIKNTRG